MYCRHLFSIIIISLLVLLVTPLSINSAFADEEPPQVLMIGVFHFSNPGLDMIKTYQINVMEDASQDYLETLTSRIAEEFKPTKILLEYAPDGDEAMQKRYQDYLGGNHELEADETEQLGFRVAKKAGAVPVASYDDRTVEWQAEPLFEVMETADPEIAARMGAAIERITIEAENMQKTMTLQELMLAHNDPEYDRMNMGFYLMTNSIATVGNHEGVDATASWWERNFRMYANIQRHAKAGERIMVVGGQGHTAILKTLLKIDSQIKEIDPRSLF
jgi:Family of unknown function (DUF5694)